MVKTTRVTGSVVEPETKKKQPRTSPYDELVKANYGLVASIARRYLHRGERVGLELDDLIHAGIFGLIKAYHKFDPGRGKFSTCATFWIRASINRHVMQQPQRGVSIPCGLQELMEQVNKEEQRLTQRLGRQPELRELQRACVHRLGFTEANFRSAYRCLHLRRNSLSAPNPVDPDDTPRLERILAHTDPSPEAELEFQQARQLVSAGLDCLDERSRAVIVQRYSSLSDGHSYRDIGASLGLSHERVRELHNLSLRQLRIMCSGLQDPR